jgi:DNA polymerase-3 subunit alpha
MSYIGLHQHLDSSCLDGFQTRQELVSRAKSLGMNAVAITDHGTCAIHVKFAQECAKQSDDNLTIKPIFGMESYLVDDVHDIMTDRIAHTRAGKVKYNKETGEPELEKQRASDFNHCCLWAQNDKGLENLWTVSTLSYTEGFYRKPRIDFNMLKTYGEGLFVSDGCMLSRVSRCIANDDIKGAIAWEKKLIDAVGKENVLVEIHTWQFCDPKTEEQFNLNSIMTKTNKVKIEIAKELGLRTIAVNDAHYAKREDYRWHELVWQSTTGKGSDLNDDKTSGRGETAAWVMSEDECFYWLKKHGLDDEDIQTAIDNTQWVADHCNAKIKFGMVPPRYGDSKEDDDRLLEKLVLEGARERIPSVDQAQEYMAELKKELELIEKTDLSGYFLIVWDYVNFVLSDDEDGSKYGIVGKKASLLGVARGSSGASVVCYFLRITNIDPIKNSLYFERFLTAGRVVSSVNIKFEDGWKKFSPSEKISLSDGTSKDAWKLLYEEDDTEYGKEIDSSFDFKDCPDIDLDFEASVIPQVDAYLKKRWGEWNVCRIGTELQGKISTSVHDVFAIHGYSSSDIFNLNRKIAATGWDTGEYMELQTYEDFIECISKDEDLKKIVDETEYFKEAWNFGGRIRTYGVHASGYVISKKSLLGKMPLRVAQGILVTQFSHDQVASMGFIKYDVLKLSSLGTIREVYENVHGKLDPESIYADMQNDKLFDGAAIWKPTWDGDVLGIFQLDTPLGKTTATNAIVNSVSDAGMITAVDRPGLVRSGLIKDFYKVRKGEEGCPSYHPFTDSILEETSGFVVYQEQIMKIYSRLCNMNMEEADNVRKVFSKKQVTKVPAMKKLLYDVCLNDKNFIDSVPVKYSSPKECLDDLWVGISRTAEYSFNKSHCLDGHTLVKLDTGECIYMSELFKRYESGEELKIMSMMPDGKIASAKIHEVMKSGIKELLTITLANGALIRATPEHRFLTTRGYVAVKDFRDDEELIFDSKHRYAHTSLSKAMKDTQSRITHEQRCKHQQNVQKIHPDRCKNGYIAGQKSLMRLREDEEWSKRHNKNTSIGIQKYWNGIDDKKHARKWTGFTFWQTMSKEELMIFEQSRAKKMKATLAKKTDDQWQEITDKIRNTKLEHGCVNFGKKTFLSDGRLCDSMFEAKIGEYLIDRGVKFSLHKQLRGQGDHKHVFCDFYANGVYIEADGLYRGDDFFKNKKYGDDLPFLVLYPNDWKYKIDAMLMGDHVSNGIKVVSIEKKPLPGRWHKTYGMTYDIEMDDHYPANFIANGIVSHNSMSYGMITAYEQYMKVRWPLQFICASLNTDPGQIEFLKYAIVRGYNVKTPNVNKSTDKYVVDNNTIYMPMWSIKGVGGKAVEEILNNGPYSSYDDFLDKTTGRGGRKKNVLQSLISIGAFDGVDERSRYDLMCAFAESKGLEKPYKKNFESDRIIAKIEQELLGVSLSYDDVLDNKDWLSSESPQSMAGLMKTDVGESTKIAGKITSTKTKNAKNGLMAWVTLKLVSQEEVKITVFANSYSRFKDYLSTGDLVSIMCKRSSDFNGAPSFICNYVFNKSIQQDK